MMTYDKDATLPATVKEIAEIALFVKDNRLKVGESLFIPDFPVDMLSVLNSALIILSAVAVPIAADNIYGGAGVRVLSLLDLKNMAENIPPERKEQDWTATRKSANTWLERIDKWFGTPTADLRFYWNKSVKRVEVRSAADESELPADWCAVSPIAAYAFMTANGEPYRNGKDVPPPYDAAKDYLNVWVGHKMVVWNYNVTDDVVMQFNSQADADYHKSSKGVKYTFEDAPLIAWLAYNAAKAYKDGSIVSLAVDAPDTPADDEWGDL